MAPAQRHQQLPQHKEPASGASTHLTAQRGAALPSQQCKQLGAAATFATQLESVQARWERVRTEDEAEWQRQRTLHQAEWLLSLAAQQRKWDAMRAKEEKVWQERRQLEQGLWDKWVQKQVKGSGQVPARDAGAAPAHQTPPPVKRKWGEAGEEAACRRQRSWGSPEADQTPLVLGSGRSSNTFNAEHSLEHSSINPETFKPTSPPAASALRASPFSSAQRSGCPAAATVLPLPQLPLATVPAPMMLPTCGPFDLAQLGSASGMIPTPQSPAWQVDQLAGQQAQQLPLAADLAAEVAAGELEFGASDDLDTLGSDDWWLDGLLSMP